MSLSTDVAVKCGRCGIIFTTRYCPKLDHFSIYRVVCPHCSWPGRYLASELRPVARNSSANRSSLEAPPAERASFAGNRNSTVAANKSSQQLRSSRTVPPPPSSSTRGSR